MVSQPALRSGTNPVLSDEGDIFEVSVRVVRTNAGGRFTPIHKPNAQAERTDGTNFPTLVCGAAKKENEQRNSNQSGAAEKQCDR